MRKKIKLNFFALQWPNEAREIICGSKITMNDQHTLLYIHIHQGFQNFLQLTQILARGSLV